MQRHRVAPGVTAEQAGLTGVGSEEAEQDADRGRLPRAVRPQEAVHLTRRDGELEAVERPRRAEGLHEPETEIACVMVGPSL